MINPGKLFKIKGAWDTFAKNHSRFVLFLNAVNNTALEEGTIIDINVTTAEGQTLSSNIKLTRSDMELLKDITDMAKNN